MAINRTTYLPREPITIPVKNAIPLPQQFSTRYIIIDNTVFKIGPLVENIELMPYTTKTMSEQVNEWFQQYEKGQWLIEHSLSDIIVERIYDPVNFYPGAKSLCMVKEQDYTFYKLKWS